MRTIEIDENEVKIILNLYRDIEGFYQKYPDSKESQDLLQRLGKWKNGFEKAPPRYKVKRGKIQTRDIISKPGYYKWSKGLLQLKKVVKEARYHYVYTPVKHGTNILDHANSRELSWTVAQEIMSKLDNNKIIAHQITNWFNRCEEYKAQLNKVA